MDLMLERLQMPQQEDTQESSQRESLNDWPEMQQQQEEDEQIQEWLDNEEDKHEPEDNQNESEFYGLEGEYKDDFKAWCKNYHWFNRTFQEWIQEKNDFYEEMEREQREMYEDDLHYCDRHYWSGRMSRSKD